MNLDDAIRLMLETFGEKTLENELIDIGNALGRVLGEDIISPVDVPPFDRSAMDGYAIKSAESISSSQSNPAVLRVRGVGEAGEAFRGEVGTGECVEVYTGAPMPAGTDAVVMAEDCKRIDDSVHVYRAIPKFANVSLRGEDVHADEQALDAGQELRPWHIGTVASIGVGSVNVRRKVVAGVVATGSELMDARDLKGRAGSKGRRRGSRGADEGGIFDSTKPTIMALLRELGCEVIDCGAVEDDLNAISWRLRQIKAKGADIIISTGGSSVGMKDLVPEALALLPEPGRKKSDRETGTPERMIFHGLAIKPGKPTGLGALEGTPVFMLPGYPVSALIGFEAVVAPLICRWSGRKAPARKKGRAIMTRRVATTPGVRHYLRVKLIEEKEEEKEKIPKAVPLPLSGSALLSSFARADGIVVIPENVEGVEEGEEIEVEYL